MAPRKKSRIFPRYMCSFCGHSESNKRLHSEHLNKFIPKLKGHDPTINIGQHFVPLITAVRRRSGRKGTKNADTPLPESKFDMCSKWKLFNIVYTQAQEDAMSDSIYHTRKEWRILAEAFVVKREKRNRERAARKLVNEYASEDDSETDQEDGYEPDWDMLRCQNTLEERDEEGEGEGEGEDGDEEDEEGAGENAFKEDQDYTLPDDERPAGPKDPLRDESTTRGPELTPPPIVPALGRITKARQERTFSDFLNMTPHKSKNSMFCVVADPKNGTNASFSDNNTCRPVPDDKAQARGSRTTKMNITANAKEGNSKGKEKPITHEMIDLTTSLEPTMIRRESRTRNLGSPPTPRFPSLSPLPPKKRVRLFDTLGKAKTAAKKSQARAKNTPSPEVGPTPRTLIIKPLGKAGVVNVPAKCTLTRAVLIADKQLEEAGYQDKLVGFTWAGKMIDEAVWQDKGEPWIVSGVWE